MAVASKVAEIIDPANYDRYQEMVDTFVELRAKKGMTPEKADATMKGDCLILRRYACSSCWRSKMAWLSGLSTCPTRKRGARCFTSCR
ncbi:MAG: phosphate acyltransferase [Veillonella sp.]